MGKKKRKRHRHNNGPGFKSPREIELEKLYWEKYWYETKPEDAQNIAKELFGSAYVTHSK